MSLFRATLRKVSQPAARSFSRHASDNPFVNAVLRNNFSYVTAIVGAGVVAEFVYGKATYGVWSMMNNGVSLLQTVKKY